MATTVSELIRTDHREMERLFSELKSPEKRALTAPTIVALLAAHSRAEESEVYPTLRHATGAADEVAHSQKEHVEADQLAALLVDTDLDSPTFEAVLKKLVDAVSHHIEEEESDVLPALDELPTQTQENLASAFLRVRAEHLMAGTTAMTRSELETQARNEGIEGTSSMTKDELAGRV
jgi:hemerythrin-like domain-containing protein